LRQLEFRWRQSEAASPRQITGSIGRWLVCPSPSLSLAVGPVCAQSVGRSIHPTKFRLSPTEYKGSPNIAQPLWSSLTWLGSCYRPLRAGTVFITGDDAKAHVSRNDSQVWTL
jgi:hypothetical protein